MPPCGSRLDRDSQLRRARSCWSVAVRSRARASSVVVDRFGGVRGACRDDRRNRAHTEIGRTDENTPLVRTAVGPPVDGDGGGLDPWRGEDRPSAMVARAEGAEGLDVGRGTPEASDRYLLGLDPHAPDTHTALASAMMRIGIAPTLIGTRGLIPHCESAVAGDCYAW